MASEKQIAANRANALRSTGPKTVAGKRQSGQNARQHGLSLPFDDDTESVFAIAAALATEHSSDTPLASFLAVARACEAVERVRRVQAELIGGQSGLADVQVLRKLVATERYERRALTRRRREIERLGGEPNPD
jgi:hypothetical protein